MRGSESNRDLDSTVLPAEPGFLPPDLSHQSSGACFRVIVQCMTQSENMVQVSNRKTYFSSSVLRNYKGYTLTRTEALVLLKYQPYFAQKSVLDIGIGTGRTTVYLEPLAQDYVGIDFSPTFIDFVNNAMPNVCAKLGDMRDLGDFDSEHFDFVMGSFNVLDVVTHDDRLKTISEVRRVLKPGGLFIFSSHNRSSESMGSRPKLELAKDPARLVLRFFRWTRRLRNYRQWKKHWVLTKEFAIITDAGHDFAALHYYVDQATQRRQLAASGFSTLEVYDSDGNTLGPHDVDTKSPFLTYVAQRLGGEDQAPQAI
jgi:SAM-dependent methyltransferase